MTSSPEHLDVVIVGAGLSGIGAAYRVSTELKDKSFAVLEARTAIGGTWDLFRYPGVRSDSDMFTLGYPFRPWTEAKAIADGSSILRYIRETAEDPRIRERIRFSTKLIAAAWSSADARWTLDLEVTDDDGGTERRSLTCGFLYLCSGYYNYEHGHEPALAGIGNFEGQVVRPQFWPEDLDYTGKRVVIVGSGATAVTLLPNMAKDAAHVTMLQRSPTYITAVPSRDKFSDAARRRLPAGPAHHVARAKNILFTQAFYQLCRRRPEFAKKFIREQTTRILGDEQSVQENFVPAYNPWDQRLCVAPSADFFKALKSGSASVVTDTIETFTPHGVRLASGKEVEADVVVTATGLSMLPLGGATFSVDGRPVQLGDSWVYRGLMVSGVPNLALCVGYTNASWTLRADLSSRYVCRFVKYLDRHGHRYGAPTVEEGMRSRPILDLTSGYVQRAVSAFPKQGDRQPWTMRQNYLLDAPSALHGNLARNMVFDAPPPPTSIPAPDLEEIHA
ncbi:FAD-containing monooxygenase EthA [Arthrobacter sp. RIT-PI-e]|uniref:flavin-containing monooxygenase n=1 Tax=Arthrobacter sp. RIT-PI-e TaxID=1681197 RepID=UPI0006766BA0|nr:NAD(P)/FAD-dependent oxidoreductase [Arthrobacter sp. RIT-PI-e]KNC20217.1 FAD-containing monooxygenase EthA [Arthrobacter sp. RIT-PI-e]